MWNPFKRKDKDQEPAIPAAAPPAPAGPDESEKKGAFRRLADKFRRKQPPPAAPAAPAAPTAPTGDTPAPGGAGGGSGGEAPAKDPGDGQRTYPGRLAVSADGIWIISSTEWDGIMSGTLHGQDVQDFLEAMEAGDLETAVDLVAKAYDDNVADLIIVEESTIRHVGY